MVKLHELLKQDPIPLLEVAALLDGLLPEERIAAARSVPGKLQARLFEAAAKAEPLKLDDMVPAGTPPMKTVRHYGRNSLPLFTKFEKRFCRPEAGTGTGTGTGTKLYGYNHQTMSFITGPGCYVAYDGPAGEVLVDYRELPEKVPEGWPKVKPNDKGLGKLVWKNMVDHLRRVSKHVSIGRAFRGAPGAEKPEPNYFILCREDGSP